MSSVIKQLSLADLSELYKIAYGDFEADAAGWDNADLIGTFRKNNKFVGNKLQFAQLVDWGGGQSSGALPSSSTSVIYQPFLEARSVYAMTVMDNQSMKASRKAGGNVGAFKDATELSQLIIKKSFSDQIARQYFGDGTGTLGTIQSIVVNAPGDYSLTITSSSWLEAPWMLNDLYNIDVGTSLFLTTSIDLVNRIIRVVRQTGTDVPFVGNNIYKQKSRNNEMIGLKGITDAAVGSQVYGVTAGYRWQSTNIQANSQALSVKLMRDLDQKMRFACRGEMATDYIMSATQLKLFEDSEDAKSIIYIEPNISPNREAGSQVAAVKINGRTIRLHWSPWCQEDRLYAINKSKISLEIRPDTGGTGEEVGGWIENGDSIFFPLHVSGTPLDSYAMFRSTYANFYINPVFLGLIQGLAIA